MSETVLEISKQTENLMELFSIYLKKYFLIYANCEESRKSIVVTIIIWTASVFINCCAGLKDDRL